MSDHGRLERSGNVWTASAHIITAVGSGVMPLAWVVAQLGWIAGPTVIIMFSVFTYCTSSLLAACYRSGDPNTGDRNSTYMDVVRANLGGFQVKVCGAIQSISLFGGVIGYFSSNPYMIAFGVVEIIFSQIPYFDQIWWVSIVSAVMSFTYSTIVLGLGISKVAGSLTGVSIGTVTKTQKIWRTFQALGAIAFAYSFTLILIEIQDTLKSPPSESKTMKRAAFINVAVTTIFYMFCGCFGYAAFGDMSPENLLTGFGLYNPYWLLDIANVALVIPLVGAYQVYSQPLFAFVEKIANEWFPDNIIITKEIQIPIPGFEPLKLNIFRLVWRTLFVILTTIISMLMPYFNHVVGILGAFAFWPLIVYFPVEMFIVQERIPRWSTKWICLQIISMTLLVISLAARVGSFAGFVTNLN
ncbi:hypothetical protein ACJIZ3_003542 [Penstemon smallii]|uniref:Amino acid transporter transmembrane domain-containing protein n=1 Tax=Penstemon smallii TaxID=265156 RepID=A0ABD3U9K3_9LAMI